MNKSEIRKWFADLGVPNFSGEAAFDSESGHQTEFVLSDDDRELLITNVIGLLDDRTDSDVYRMILRTNHLGLDTRGGCLSLAEDDETLILWRVVPVAVMDADELANAVSSFIDTAGEIRHRIFDETMEDEVKQSITPPVSTFLA